MSELPIEKLIFPGSKKLGDVVDFAFPICPYLLRFIILSSNCMKIISLKPLRYQNGSIRKQILLFVAILMISICLRSLSNCLWLMFSRALLTKIPNLTLECVQQKYITSAVSRLLPLCFLPMLL